ncbi:MAG TPA: hypothetical protein VLV18_03100 [Terriglobales bacterium]|nr:hypothetical protein [Terriglobales bacterium]
MPQSGTVYGGVAPGPMQGPMPGGTFFGPFPKRFHRFSWIAVFLLLVSASLILANAAALLYTPFFFMWVGWFPWVAQLGNFSFILGTVLGIIIIGAVILYMLDFKVLSAFMVFPAAIVSLFIGGGFWAGLIIGVLTGIFMIMHEKRPPIPWHP